MEKWLLYYSGHFLQNIRLSKNRNTFHIKTYNSEIMKNIFMIFTS